jgi:hypothetical protein
MDVSSHHVKDVVDDSGFVDDLDIVPLNVTDAKDIAEMQRLPAVVLLNMWCRLPNGSFASHTSHTSENKQQNNEHHELMMLHRGD